MKRFILFYILSSFMLGIYAQEDNYRPLVEEGKTWKYDNQSGSSEYYFFYSYYLLGDTTIAEHKCLKLFSENSNNDNKAKYRGALYETNKKVYFIAPNDTRPKLLYDFDCNIGDTLNIWEGTMIVADLHVEYQEAQPINVIVVYSTELGESLPIKWIEGVGCVNDLFSMIPNPGNNSYLLSCVSNGQYLYQYKRPSSTEKGYHKMAIEGKTWNYIHHYIDENGAHDEPYSFVVKGDTLIDERKTYKKLYRQDATGEHYYGMLQEIGREFLVRYAGDDAWYSEYHFGRTDIGRVFDWNSKYGRGRVYWMLSTIDTIHVHGQDFRRFICLQKTIPDGTPKQLSTIEDGEDVWHDIWIEGVGSQYNGVERSIHEAQPEDNYSYLVSCYENGECIFTADDFTTGIRNISTDDYRPFVEDGKVWKTGWFEAPKNLMNEGEQYTANAVEYLYFDGDTIVGQHLCKKLMLSVKTNSYEDTHYIAAVYEEEQRVWCETVYTKDFFLLYDFGLSAGDTVSVYDSYSHLHNIDVLVPGPGYAKEFIYKCTLADRKESKSKSYKGIVQSVNLTNNWFLKDVEGGMNVEWRQGVGYMGPYNMVPSLENDVSYYSNSHLALMQCTVGDEVIYNDDALLDPFDKTNDNESGVPIDPEVKKQWLDFTHTVKTKPKGPRKDGSPSTGSETGMMEEGNGTDEAQALTGEYSAKELFVSLQPLAGPYTVSISNAAGKVVYEKEVQTSNVVALNTDLTKYADGTYSLTVENADEAYTATLTIGEGTAIRNLSESPNNGFAPSSKFKVQKSKLFDLSGRRLSAPPARGVYIEDGKLKCKRN